LIKKSKKHNKNIDFLPRFVYDKYSNKRNKQVNIYNKRMGAKIVGKIISVANQKGGVGKTTTTINLSTMLAKKGKKVLLIDADPQGNATSGVGAEKEVEYSTYDILVSDVEMVQALEKTIIKNLLVCPSNINLAGAEVELVSMMSREQRLKEKLEEVKDKFDYILIDCPPSLGLITLNAFTASDSVLIPVQCEYYALEGLGQLLNTINLVKKHLNKHLEIEGALLTMYDARTNLSNQVVKEVKKYFGDKVYKTVIPRNVRLSEAPSYGMPITEYDPRSKGAKTYEKFTKEFLKINDADKKGKHLI
jgi:chromosome partitioning protein